MSSRTIAQKAGYPCQIETDTFLRRETVRPWLASSNNMPFFPTRPQRQKPSSFALSYSTAVCLFTVLEEAASCIKGRHWRTKRLQLEAESLRSIHTYSSLSSFWCLPLPFVVLWRTLRRFSRLLLEAETDVDYEKGT